MTKPKKKGAAAVIRDGVAKGQTDKVIKAKVRRAFPDYACLDRVLRWARAHPEWVRGEYGKNGKRKRGK